MVEKGFELRGEEREFKSVLHLMRGVVSCLVLKQSSFTSDSAKAGRPGYGQLSYLLGDHFLDSIFLFHRVLRTRMS